MNPDQDPTGLPPATPPAQPVNPYSFITDTQHHQKKSLIKGGSFRSRILLTLGGGTAVVILVVVISQLVFSNKTSNVQLLTSLAAEQQEITRIADVGVKSASDLDVRDLAQTTKSSVLSQQITLRKYLSSKEVKLTPLILNAKKSKTTDATLSQAFTNNSFDKVYVTTLKQMLKTYSVNVKKSYDVASNKTSKSMLADSYNTTATLLKD